MTVTSYHVQVFLRESDFINPCSQPSPIAKKIHPISIHNTSVGEVVSITVDGWTSPKITRGKEDSHDKKEDSDAEKDDKKKSISKIIMDGNYYKTWHWACHSTTSEAIWMTTVLGGGIMDKTFLRWGTGNGLKYLSEAFWMTKVLGGGIMDWITRKCMRCDCHIVTQGYFG